MPYIETEAVKKMREEIKKAFPQYKFSVTKEHHSSVHVNIMKGPIPLENESINIYWYMERLKDKPELFTLVDGIMKIIRDIKKVDYHEDGDYGSIPTYYSHIQIGKWNKPYEQVTK